MTERVRPMGEWRNNSEQHVLRFSLVKTSDGLPRSFLAISEAFGRNEKPLRPKVTDRMRQLSLFSYTRDHSRLYTHAEGMRGGELQNVRTHLLGISRTDRDDCLDSVGCRVRLLSVRKTALSIYSSFRSSLSFLLCLLGRYLRGIMNLYHRCRRIHRIMVWLLKSPLRIAGVGVLTCQILTCLFFLSQRLLSYYLWR